MFQTPDNSALSSTFVENGTFVLAVPNPIVGGKYACHVDATSAAAMCVQPNSTLAVGGSLIVDSTQAYIMLMSSQLQVG
jgi:hypothetical protein